MPSFFDEMYQKAGNLYKGVGAAAEQLKDHLGKKFLHDNERESHPDLPGVKVNKDEEHPTAMKARKKYGPGMWQGDIGED